MSVPLVILAFGSIFVGYLFKDMIIGPGTPFFGNSIFVLPSHVNIFEAEFLAPSTKFIPVIFSLMGAAIGFLVYHFSLHLSLVLATPIVPRAEGEKKGSLQLGGSSILLTLYTFFNTK